MVYATSGASAIKVHERQRGYLCERDVYLRLQDREVTHVAGFAVPLLCGYDDRLFVIEMTIVDPPYILDFAKAYLDLPPEFPRHVMEEREQHWADLFDERWPRVQAIMGELEHRYGVFMLDPTPRNIAFVD